jgi:hypothetical protein
VLLIFRGPKVEDRGSGVWSCVFLARAVHNGSDIKVPDSTARRAIYPVEPLSFFRSRGHALDVATLLACLVHSTHEEEP